MDPNLPQLKDMQDILDLKPVEVWDYTYWFWGIGLFLALVLALWILYWWLKRRHARKSIPAPLTPLQIARRRLQELLASDLLDSGNLRKFYFRLSELFRAFLEEEIRISASEATLEELKPLLKKCPDFTGEELQQIFQFLEISDMAKFAKYRPEKSQVDANIRFATEMMESLARRRLPPEGESTTKAGPAAGGLPG